MESLPRRAFFSTGAVAAVSALAFAPGAFAQQPTRVDPIPTGPERVVEALSPFAGAPDSSGVADLLADQAETGFPASDYDRVLVARLWRRAGATDLAVETLRSVPASSDAVDLATYEAARVLFAARREAPGARAYWTACGSDDERVRAEVMWDLLAVTIPEEREAWSEVAPGEPTCEWLRGLWNERAWRAEMGRDARVAVHFRRLEEARSQYRLKRPRFLEGMSDEYGRPDGLDVDDRGMLWIRLGPPVASEGCPEQVGIGDDPPNLTGECWIYWRPGGYELFYMDTRDRFGHNWPNGDYRIQENLGQQAEPGTKLFQKYVMNADMPATLKRALVQRGPVYRNQRLRSVGVVTDVRDSLLDSLDVAEYSGRLSWDLRRVTRRYAAKALEQIPDAPDIESTVRMRFEPLRFLNPSSGAWQIWLLSSVRAGDLERSDGDPPSLAASGRYAVLRGGELAREDMAPIRLEAPDVEDDAGLNLRGVVTAPPGPLPVTVVIEDENAPGTGAWVQDTVRVPSIGGLPQLSDIAIAQHEGGTWTRDGRTFLQVSPAHVTNPDGSIHTYFEVYGVRPGTRYEVEFRLASVEAAERIWRLEPDDLGFRLQFTSEMPGDIGRHHLRLDLGETEPGEYALAVRIQDEDTKAYSLPSVTDVFVRHE